MSAPPQTPGALASACRKLLRSGPIPSLANLDTLCRRGFIRLINVCETDLAEIYPAECWLTFELHQFPLRKVFSTTAPAATPAPAETVDTNEYLGLTTAAERDQFLRAVQTTLENLAQGRASYVFCYRGRRRSPAVAAAALRCAFAVPLLTAVETVRLLEPAAELSPISLAAIEWSVERIHAERIHAERIHAERIHAERIHAERVHAEHH